MEFFFAVISENHRDCVYLLNIFPTIYCFVKLVSLDFFLKIVIKMKRYGLNVSKTAFQPGGPQTFKRFILIKFCLDFELVFRNRYKMLYFFRFVHPVFFCCICNCLHTMYQLKKLNQMQLFFKVCFYDVFLHQCPKLRRGKSTEKNV